MKKQGGGRKKTNKQLKENPEEKQENGKKKNEKDKPLTIQPHQQQASHIATSTPQRCNKRRPVTAKCPLVVTRARRPGHSPATSLGRARIIAPPMPQVASCTIFTRRSYGWP
jgi:hypothetical protein